MLTQEYDHRISAYWPHAELREMSGAEERRYREKIKVLLIKKNAVIIAHYYVDSEIQRLAEETGGMVSDSLEMARFGAAHSATTLVVAGVKFMGETAKILSPDKKILMPTLKATCSLDLSCQSEEFDIFCNAHPDRIVVVYANTSAAVKARADWVVTSSIALSVIAKLHAEGKKIIWAPDRYLGQYIQFKTGADMLLWQGSCVVHEEFKANALKALKAQYPDAGILVHPESPAEVIALADCVGSTSQLLKASQLLPHQHFIVATDKGIFYKMRQASPHKTFIEAPTGGQGATCKSCAHCPWMALNQLDNLTRSLESGSNEVLVDSKIVKRAKKALDRMLEFKL